MRAAKTDDDQTKLERVHGDVLGEVNDQLIQLQDRSYEVGRRAGIKLADEAWQSMCRELLQALERLADLAEGFSVSGVHFNEVNENRYALHVAGEAQEKARVLFSTLDVTKSDIRLMSDSFEALSLLKKMAARGRHRGSLTLSDEDLCEIDEIIGKTTGGHS